jgi:hypothetical protein
MAVYQYRSRSNSLAEGATDGKYRKVRPNTEVAPGLGEELVKANRAGLHPFFNYGFIDTETQAKVVPGASDAKKVAAQSYGAPTAYINNYMTQQEQ